MATTLRDRAAEAARVESFSGEEGTHADRARQVKAMRESNGRLAAAYHAGRHGHAVPDGASEQERQAHRAGREEAANPVAGPPRGPRTRPQGRPGRTGSRGGTGRRPRGAWVGKGPTGTMRRTADTITGGPGAGLGRTGGGLLLGMVGYCLVINLIRYGTPGVTGWISAKFWNQPMGTTPAKVNNAPFGGKTGPGTPYYGTGLNGTGTSKKAGHGTVPGTGSSSSPPSTTLG